MCFSQKKFVFNLEQRGIFMDLKSIYYFKEVTVDMNITKTANRLYLSQQTLSNHILRLEKHFGVELLHRKPSLSLTYAGELVLNFANYVLPKEKNLEDILADVRKEERGLIRFGASTMRTSVSLPTILEDFSSRYPDVELRITNANSLPLEKMIIEGTLDLAVIIETDQHKELNYIPLMNDPVYLCVTDEILETYYGKEMHHLKEISRNGADISNFAKVPFCILNNRLGKNVNLCFDEAGISPVVYTTSNYIQITTALGVRGLAATFATKASLREQYNLFSSDLNIFPLLYHNKPLIQKTFLIRRKNRYISNYSKYFIERLIDFFEKLEKTPVDKISEPL